MAVLQSARPTNRRAVWRFTRHYLEMILAMLIGMATLYPLWAFAVGEIRLDVDMLAMATAMVIPMAAWMRYRGHGAAPIVEMSLAMYAGFVVLFPFHWWGGLGEMGLMTIGHILMPLFMLLAMLGRRHEYAHC